MTKEKTIYNMLTENTGIYMCDSGGVNGRSWQHNQKKTLKDFQNEPQATIELNDSDPLDHYVTISLFHYLQNDSIELDDLCNKFNQLPCESFDGDAHGIDKKQSTWLKKHNLIIKDDTSFNTYNNECLLSQTLQGVYVKHQETDDTYVLLQIHNGADVRGGYTDAKLFKLTDDYLPSEYVYGSVNDIQVSNTYDGVNLRIDDDNIGKEVPITKKDKVKLFIIN